ncbi:MULTISPECIES: helix-turn-helix transcriptional regulator [Citricoccus]|uniref:helix-turn-helix transcriptional regulator n=1 Tax=Citricoccus TaxID=169133 RepID=UPI000255F152
MPPGPLPADPAAGLFISQVTVKTHLNHVFQKLGVGNRTEAVTVARSLHLIRG